MKRIPAQNRKFEFTWYFIGWETIQLGLTFDFLMMNFELHLPFGFFRIGMESKYAYYEA